METKDYINNIENGERRFLLEPVTIDKKTEDSEDRSPVFGYAIKFNKETVIAGLFREVVRPGAADVFLQDDVRCLFNHNPNLILARSKNGKGTLKLEVDEVGLKYSYISPNRSYALDLEDAIEKGDVSQSSFGFTVAEEKWTEVKGQLPLREIIKFDRAYDVSPVTYPAYPDATVGKRSFDNHKNEKIKQIEINSAQQIQSENEQEQLTVRQAQCLIYNY